MNKAPLSVYIHVPFCRSKCRYCDFPSYAGAESAMPDYFQALEKEISQKAAALESYEIGTIFFGGGTPSLVESIYIQKILEKLDRAGNISQCCEITLEANPGTLDCCKLQDYRAMGINRLSIGLQSTCDCLLKRLGRIHDYAQFTENFNAARQAGFGNINVDLMFALPGQQIEQWQQSLKDVIKLAPEHLSLYALIIEEGTPLAEDYANRAITIDEETDRKMYHIAREITADAGYLQYELSNFALPGKACRHNIGCWQLKPYLGFGSGAHSFFNNSRFGNVSDIYAYIQGINRGNAQLFRETCTAETLKEEFFMLGLRMNQGVSAAVYQEMFHENMWVRYQRPFSWLADHELIVCTADGICLTPQGMDVANRIIETIVLS